MHFTLGESFLITLKKNNCLSRVTELSGARLKHTQASLSLDTLPLTRRVSGPIFKSHYLVGEDTKPSGDFKTRGAHVPSLKKEPCRVLGERNTPMAEHSEHVPIYKRESLGFPESQEEAT